MAKGIYELMTDKTFIGFNDFLKEKHIELDEITSNQNDFYKQVAYYVHGIEFRLIDWYEAYKDAD